MQSLPEINNAMSFLTISKFITGPNNTPGIITMWVSQNVTFNITDEIINYHNKDQERNIAVLGILHGDQ